MIVRPAALRPMELALGLRDRQVVDTGVAPLHETERIELPVLVAIRAKPVTRVVAPLVGEAHGDAVIGKGPKLLDQPIIEFAAPLACQEFNDLIAASRKFGAIAPLAVGGVSERHTRRIAAESGRAHV